MNDNPLAKADQAQPLALRAGLDEPAVALLMQGLTPGQYLERLIAQGQLPAAVLFLAWALGRREAVWWACRCVALVVSDRDRPEELAALEAARRWAAAPTEDNRRLAEAAAAAAGYATPAGCVAVAAFWSGGSLAPARLAAVSPPEHLLPGAVASSILLAAVKREPEKAEDKYRQFLALGQDVAAARDRWAEEKPATGGRREEDRNGHARRPRQ
jgi:hypothetical protein